MKHEILEEVWRVRDEISAECGHDLGRLAARVRALEPKYADRLVSYAPRPPKAVAGKPPTNTGKSARKRAAART